MDSVKFEAGERKRREQKLISDLWAWLTLLAVCGAFALTWVFLLVLKLLKSAGYL